ncbi:flagellar hook-length control protein FliK [Nitrospinota bacterium]
MAATVEGPAAGAPPGTLMLALSNAPPALIRAAFPLQPGERLAVEVEGKGNDQTLRVLARSGSPETALEPLREGQVRLAQNQSLTAGLRSVLANAKGTILGEILPFRHPGSAPVRIGALKVNFQLDGGARSGDRLYVRPQEVGGSLGLRVFARGGGRSLPGPSGATGLLQIVRVGPGAVRLGPLGGLPAPGLILTGTLLSVSPAPSVGADQAPGNPAGSHLNPLQSSLPSGSGLAGAAARPAINAEVGQPAESLGLSPGSRAGQHGRAVSGRGPVSGRIGGTAILRFPGFDAEVPWPAGAAYDFQPGAPVRVLVNQAEPVLNLLLLAPSHAGEAEAFLPAGGAGVSGFGTNLITLAEGLGGAAAQVPPGEVARAYEGLLEALNQVVLKEDGLSAGRIQEAIRQSGALFPAAENPEGAGGTNPDLRESLQQFVRVLRGTGLPDGNLLSQLSGQAEQTLTAVEFLQTVNGLRHFLDQGTYLQIPFSLGGERGTMDIVVRRDGERRGGRGENDQHSAVFLLELEGLGPLRVDAGIQGKRVHARFTTPNEEVGKFIEAEMPKLRESIESQDFIVEGISWMHDQTSPEPVVPSFSSDDPTGDSSFINLRV